MLYNEDSSSVERLLIKQQQNTISPEELAHLEQLVGENPEAKAFAEFYTHGPLQELKSDEEVQSLWMELEGKMQQSSRKIFPVGKRWLAAASVLLIIAAGGYMVLKPQA